MSTEPQMPLRTVQPTPLPGHEWKIGIIGREVMGVELRDANGKTFTFEELSIGKEVLVASIFGGYIPMKVDHIDTEKKDGSAMTECGKLMGLLNFCPERQVWVSIGTCNTEALKEITF